MAVHAFCDNEKIIIVLKNLYLPHSHIFVLCVPCECYFRSPSGGCYCASLVSVTLDHLVEVVTVRLLVSDTLDHLVEVVTPRLLVSVTLDHRVEVVTVRLLVSVTSDHQVEVVTVRLLVGVPLGHL